ncbi:hypothetical protein OG772_23320 [Streptomyces sp. NBC_01321]|uniref:hypothetical protein n=1 Tax=unclassified Streptomyces TaxID=2593676 RepID=UPI002E0F4F73|nr:hypothetical protein OG772_23320 [Streptomyces sp. NBC_01321]WSP55202.1 hypothetical protein OG306_12980 [Streptomyces sp. NBC_01241]
MTFLERDEYQRIAAEITEPNARALADWLVGTTKDIRGNVANHETRLRALEGTVWRAGGGAAVLGAGAGVLVQLLLR